MGICRNELQYQNVLSKTFNDLPSAINKLMTAAICADRIYHATRSLNSAANAEIYANLINS